MNTNFKQRYEDAQAMVRAAMNALAIPANNIPDTDQFNKVITAIRKLLDTPYEDVMCGIMIFQTKKDDVNFDIVGSMTGNIEQLTALEMLLAARLEGVRIAIEEARFNTQH